MLHILWILIKFILMFLAILLGLVVLVLLLILFCPIRYQASAAKEGVSFFDASASARISWLFGGISFRLDYKDRNTGYELRILGIPVFRLLNYLRERKKKRQRTAGISKTNGQTLIPEDSIDVRTYKSLPDSQAFTDTFHTANSVSGEDSPTDSSTDEFSNTTDSEDQQRLIRKIENLCYSLGRKLRALFETLQRFWQKLCGIPKNIENFTLTIKNICDKINMFRDFLEHPRVKAAIALVKDHFIKLLRHVFPTKIKGNLTFGSTDPSITGSVLAVLGMTIPLHKNCIAVTPVFEDKNILKGNISLKGRIYGVFLIKTALELYFNKNIKYVIRRWKHKHKED